MPEPKNRLRIRSIDTVGFVGKGDDPDAEIVFFKRHDEGDAPMNEPEIRSMFQKILDAVTGKNPTQEGVMPFEKNDLPDEARAYVDGLEAQIEELKTEVAAATATPPADPAEPDVLKSLSADQREAIEKRMAAQEAEIAKAREEVKTAREEAAVEKRERRMEVFRKQAAGKLVAIKGETDEIAEMLYAVEENLPEDMAKRVIDSLETASTQLSTNSKLVSEIGKHGGDAGPDSAWGQIEKAAGERKAADPNLTIEQARAAVMTDPANARLVEAYRSERQ